MSLFRGECYDCQRDKPRTEVTPVEQVAGQVSIGLGLPFLLELWIEGLGLRDGKKQYSWPELFTALVRQFRSLFQRKS